MSKRENEKKKEVRSVDKMLFRFCDHQESHNS